MLIGVLIFLFSLAILIIIHELGHFLVAKKFKVRVDEFGLGLPPRIFGKKFGETLYSLNWIPFGGFVKIFGETEKIKDPRSFSEKPIWQRLLIILAGVASFWIIAFILLTIMHGVGMPTVLTDQDIVEEAKVQIIDIEKNSPADLIGLKIEDIIKKIQDQEIDKVSQVQEITQEYSGQEVSLLIERNKEEKEIIVGLRELDQGGALGVGLARTGIKKYSWYEAPIQGFLMTGRITSLVVLSLADVIYRGITRQGMPEGVDIAGPVGIVILSIEFFEQGLFSYLFLMVQLAITLAIINLLPIPALDGGRALFLIIEKIKGRSVDNKLEQKLIISSFIFLLILIAIVTYRDIMKLEFFKNLFS